MKVEIEYNPIDNAANGSRGESHFWKKKKKNETEQCLLLDRILLRFGSEAC